MPSAVRTLLLAGAATALAVGGGTWWVARDDEVDDPGASSGPIAVRSIALEDFDTSTVAIARASFCGRVPPESVTEALGRDVGDDETDTQAWENGDDVPADTLPQPTASASASPSTDVGHEYGCRYVSGGRRPSVAQAWVFAPPVTAAEARDLVSADASAEGCATRDGAPDYGSPSVSVACTTTGADGAATTSVSWSGLFGDAWLTCEVEEETRQGTEEQPPADEESPTGEQPSADLVDRTGRWCVTVARSASQ